MKDLEVLLCFPELDPTKHEPQVSTQIEILTYLEGEHEVAEAGLRVCKSPRVAGESWLGHGNSNPDVG